MSEYLPTLALLAALAVIVLLARRLRQAHRNHSEHITAAKTTLARELSQCRAERDQLLNALTEGFLLVDADSRILFANQFATTMFRNRELLGRNIDEALLNPRLSQALAPCLKSGKALVTRVLLPQQASLRGAPEQHGMNAWIIDAARLSDSPVTRVLIRDVTSEYQTEQIRKDFVANASHELRTPLAIISGYLENLIDDELLDDPKLALHFLKVMRKHTDRISRIIEDMLVISRLESGESAALRIKPFPIHACIQDVLERLESMIQAQHAQIHIEMPDPAITINGDRFYWTQALFNLIENSLKQNPGNGLKIEIGCLREQDQIRLWVADDGVGIASSNLPHIFRRFYRVEKHHNQEQIKGTGLGLSIVKRAIEAHGGTIGVSSTPGQDTRFTITIP